MIVQLLVNKVCGKSQVLYYDSEGYMKLRMMSEKFARYSENIRLCRNHGDMRKTQSYAEITGAFRNHRDIQKS